MQLQLTEKQDKELNELTAQLFEIQKKISAKREQIKAELMEACDIRIGDKCTVEIYDTGAQETGYVHYVEVSPRSYPSGDNRCFVYFNKATKSGEKSKHRLYSVKSIIHIRKQPTNDN